MKITWLTQAGLRLRNERLTVMVDPYLSDALGEQDPARRRRIPVDERFLVAPDVLILTHAHADHTDLQTLRRLLSGAERRVTVLASASAYDTVRALGGEHRVVLMRPHSVWSERHVTFYAVRAEHSDPHAIGVIVDDGNRTYYVTGDTLYNYEVLDDVLELVEDGVDAVFLPINGEGNNMNATDAADFAYELGAKRAIPLHYGLFDDIDPDTFDFEDRLILRPYEEVEF